MISTLRAESLARSFGTGRLRTQALRDVSLELRTGEMTVLMGPSGSGKSTLLAILAGLLRPDAGAVETLGTDMWSLSEREREMFRLKNFGFVFQGYNLFPALTARQQLEIVLQWGSGTSREAAQESALSTLSLLGLKEKAHLRPQQLSGGEKQRVAIGRALVKRPAMIFADEPTAALDWKHGEQVVQLLRQAARDQNATVLVVAHDPRIGPMADRVVHLEDGRITQN